MAEGDPFPGTGSLRVCNLTDFDALVTTDSAHPWTVAAYGQAGGKVLTV